MNLSTNNEIEVWEGEGGARSGLLDSGSIPMRGTPAQVEWAQRIKLQVNAEFDRVAASFRLVAARQSSEVRTDTKRIIAILEDKRSEVLGREDAGYFIHDWQEISDQVRRMIFKDSRYRAIKADKAARNSFKEGHIT